MAAVCVEFWLSWWSSLDRTGVGDAQIDFTLTPAIRLKAVACATHTHTLLSTQLPSDQMFFSLLFHISRQDVFFSFTHRIF